MTKNYSLIKRLQAKFSEDSQLREKCVRESKNSITHNAANRVFDSFPVMLDESQLSTLLDAYQQLLKHSSKKEVRDFEKKIIKIACDELLDEKGNLSEELLEMIEWKECKDKINNYLAVCAFVGIVNITLTELSESVVKNNQYTYLAMTKLVNENYSGWIREYMNQNKIKYNPQYDTDQIKVTDVLLYPFTHPLFSLSIFAGGLIGLGIYGSAKLAQEIYQEHAPLTLPELPSL